MSLAAFLAELRRQDIQVWSEGGALRCSAPDGVLTPELRDGLRLRKPELLEFLRAAQADDTKLRAVVPLQKGGPLPPVFALPGHNGDVFCYRALVQALGKDRPFYGLQPPGVDGASAPLMSVQELAAYFAPQVRALQSKAPFIIAGFCAGGTVAFELAQQLAADGAAVEFVALFGTPHPVFFGLASQLRVQPSRRMHQVAQHLRAMATGNWKYLAQKWRNKARETIRPEAVVQFRHRVERATLVALRRYRPRPFPGDLKLFVPSPSWARANLALRWQSMAKRTEVYYGLEGHTNDTMLLAPQAAFYAALFRDACAQPSKAGSPTERRQAPMRAVRLDGLPGRHLVEALTR